MKIMLDKDAVLPHRAHPTDAGLDLFSREEQIILPGQSAVFDTGVHVELPEGTSTVFCRRDFREFLIETEYNFTKNMVAYLKNELGLKALKEPNIGNISALCSFGAGWSYSETVNGLPATLARIRFWNVPPVAELAIGVFGIVQWRGLHEWPSAKCGCSQ